MQSKEDNFTLSNYKRCLTLAHKKKYKFFKLEDLDSSLEYAGNKIILRHDVDTQLSVAVKIAEIEQSLNIQSTFFIRLHSHAYNPLCFKDLVEIKKISSLGHEIGLHYESDFYNIFNNKKSIKDWIDFEVEILENVLRCKIKTICPHEPTRTKQFHVNDIDYNQAYDEKIFNNYKYISDSSCRWRDGSFYENLKNDISNLYVLTHPYWWYNSSPIENY